METPLWILQGSLAAILLVTGLVKLLQPRARMAATGHMDWAHQVSDGQFRTIGLLELLAVIGLVLPEALGIAPVPTPLAAVGVVALMIGAAATHRRLGETERLPLVGVFLLVAPIVAIARLRARDREGA